MMIGRKKTPFAVQLSLETVKFTNFTAENTLYLQKVECIFSCEISYCLHNAATYTAS